MEGCNLQLIREAHTSTVVGHFDVGKTIAKACVLEDAYFDVPTSLVIESKVYTITNLYLLELGKEFCGFCGWC